MMNYQVKGPDDDGFYWVEWGTIRKGPFTTKSLAQEMARLLQADDDHFKYLVRRRATRLAQGPQMLGMKLEDLDK